MIDSDTQSVPYFFSSPNIIRVTKLQKMGQERHVTLMVERRGEVHTGLWWKILGERIPLDNRDIDCRIILNGSSNTGCCVGVKVY